MKISGTAQKILAAAMMSAFVVAAEVPSALAKNMEATEGQKTVAGQRQRGNIIKEYFPFFEHAVSNSGHSCCGMKDGVIVKPDDVVKTNDQAKPYRVRLTHTVSGLRLQEPVWLEITSGQVLSGETVNKICDTYNEKAEAEGIDSICDAPSVNVVFINDGTSFDPKTRKHKVNGKLYNPGRVISAEEYGKTGSDITKYCFFPPQNTF